MLTLYDGISNGVKENYPCDGAGSPDLNPTLFQSREYDTDLGLYFNRARYYDPGIGRFINPDLIYPRTVSYSFNDPVNNSDPSGMLPPFGIGFWFFIDYYYNWPEETPGENCPDDHNPQECLDNSTSCGECLGCCAQCSLANDLFPYELCITQCNIKWNCMVSGDSDALEYFTPDTSHLQL